MARTWVVLGDSTSGGGKVITGSPFTDIAGNPVARVSDKATCPTHKGVFPIVDGDPTTIIDGQQVALHGSKMACGCTVLAVQQLRVFVDDGDRRALSTPIAMRAAHDSVPTSECLFHEQYRAVNAVSGEPVADQAYRIELENGRSITGMTDANGLTERVSTRRPEQVRLIWLQVSSCGDGLAERDCKKEC